MRLVLLGPPGAGKGTQAALLAARIDAPHISTGEILRRAIELATPTGVEAQGYVERGELVPFEIMLRMVHDRLQEEDARRGWILDGYPRNDEQARAFADLLEQLEISLERVVYLSVADEHVIRRLGGRRLCRSCQAPCHLEFSPPARAGVCDRCGGELYQRSDDVEAAIRKRLRVYHEETDPLVSFYRARELLLEIDAGGTVEEVAAVVARSLGLSGEGRQGRSPAEGGGDR